MNRSKLIEKNSSISVMIIYYNRVSVMTWHLLTVTNGWEIAEQIMAKLRRILNDLSKYLVRITLSEDL